MLFLLYLLPREELFSFAGAGLFFGLAFACFAGLLWDGAARELFFACVSAFERVFSACVAFECAFSACSPAFECAAFPACSALAVLPLFSTPLAAEFAGRASDLPARSTPSPLNCPAFGVAATAGLP
jgi:hypothetical protein